MNHKLCKARHCSLAPSAPRSARWDMFGACESAVWSIWSKVQGATAVHHLAILHHFGAIRRNLNPPAKKNVERCGTPGGAWKHCAASFHGGAEKWSTVMVGKIHIYANVYRKNPHLCRVYVGLQGKNPQFLKNTKQNISRVTISTAPASQPNLAATRALLKGFKGAKLQMSILPCRNWMFRWLLTIIYIYIWMDGWMDACMHAYLDGWMHVCRHACMDVCMCMCVCACVCTYVYVYFMCMSVYVCVCLYVHVCVCMCMYVYVCVCMCMYVCMYVCICCVCLSVCRLYVYVCMYVCVCMYVYVCVCMYVYVCVCMCMYVCVCMYVCMCIFYVCVSVYVCVCICMCMYVYVAVCSCMYVCVYVCVCRCMYVCVYVCVCMCVCMKYNVM